MVGPEGSIAIRDWSNAVNRIANISDEPIGGQNISVVIERIAILRGSSDLCGGSTMENKSRDLLIKQSHRNFLM